MKISVDIVLNETYNSYIHKQLGRMKMFKVKMMCGTVAYTCDSVQEASEYGYALGELGVKNYLSY